MRALTLKGLVPIVPLCSIGTQCPTIQTEERAGDSGADGAELETRRDALARSTAGDLGVTDVGARRGRAGALVERVDGGFAAALGKRRQLRLGQRRHLDEPLIERLVEPTAAPAAAHEREHPVGAIRFLAP